jgi:hypothetical protein
MPRNNITCWKHSEKFMICDLQFKISTTRKTMKTQFKFTVALLLLSTINLQLSTAFAQGSLTPPGPPGPLFKTLGQVEPRTPVSSAPFAISQPGSYYLTTNLTVSTGDAITINVDGVTLDLMGFTISSTAASATGAGISLNSALSDITVLNGHIRGGVTNNGSGVYSGTGFAYGIYYSGVAPVNVLITRISVSSCLNFGINVGVGDSTLVESCTVRTVGNRGIVSSTIKNSSAIDCGTAAIYGDQVSDCRGQSSGSGYGVYAISAQNCFGQGDGNVGLYAINAQNCYGASNNNVGLGATTAVNCFGLSTNGYGISAGNALNSYGSCYNSDGIDAETAQNCEGHSFSNGVGISVSVAQGCFGSSYSGVGLFAEDASFCWGSRTHGSGTAIQAIIATGCYAEVGTNSITYKYNMP